MEEIKKVQAFLEKINNGPKFNLLQVVTDKDETLQISDWEKLPLKEKANYLLEIKESRGYINLVSATTLDGDKIEHKIKNTIKRLKETMQGLTKELDTLEKVV